MRVVRLVVRSRLWRDRWDALDFVLAHLKTKRAKRTIKQRKVYAETIFAEAKNSHGLRRAICRGLDKVTISRLWRHAVQNIKRLIKHSYASEQTPYILL